MSRPHPQRPARPLDPSTLEALALTYVGRFATTEARLAAYLRRKIALRGWAGKTEPPIDGIVRRFVVAGYIDDAQFAAARSRSFVRRGYGHRRVAQALDAAGVDRAIADALAPDREAARAAAEAFARRRRLGPYCESELTPAASRRHFAALVRAGHDFEFARLFSTKDANDTMAE